MRRTARLSMATRLSIGLSVMTASVVLLAVAVGFIPDSGDAELRYRAQIGETVLAQSAPAIERRDWGAARMALHEATIKHHEILSTGIRTPEGQLLLETGDHKARWATAPDSGNSATHLRFPITSAGKLVGELQLCFTTPTDLDPAAWYLRSDVQLIAFISFAGFLATMVFLRRALQDLDPSRVVWERVKALLDTLGEGVLVLDKDETIVLSNSAFQRLSGRSARDLSGAPASAMPWATRDGTPVEVLPWIRSIQDYAPVRGVELRLSAARDSGRSLMINCSPIVGPDGKGQGTLVTFDDVTTIEVQKARLEEMLSLLEKSRDEIDRQNKELQTLATTDPLTGCLNRRSFFESFDRIWTEASRQKRTLACVMADVDHFKNINDRHGHATGDLVLQHVAKILRATGRSVDLVCRYGGEEFCLLLPGRDADGGVEAAERLRRAIEDQPCGEVRITASFGVAMLSDGASSAQLLLDQADKALYAAKRSGRNRTVRWSTSMPEAEHPAKAA